uniref:Copper chaperone for superoxide dismutase n=1 Tax=Hucho hucho TaxID=62062 RepID=A0A4W5PPZ9_9TELE
ILSIGVRSMRRDVGKEEVLVEASLTSHEVQDLIESTGRRGVLKGIGGTEQDLGAAVAMIGGSGPVQGVVWFRQLSEERCLIDGTIDGLEPGAHGFHVHTLGDLTQDCQSCGEHYNPYGRQHGASQDPDRHVGDLGNIVAGPDDLVWDVIGRSLVVDNSGQRLACGIIARSAGLFQNAKQICACDGVTLWEERDRPLAGTGRSKTTTETPAAHL